MSEGLRILIVEDNPADADLIREMLPQAGPLNFQVESAERLSGALARLERKGIGLVLLDLGLPDSQGLSTFHALRQAAPGIPVIVLSGNDDQELATNAVRDGAQDYLVKGRIGGDLLVRAIRYALERERLVSELREALAQVKTLSGLLPICAGCKKIRDDKGYWSQVESYITGHSEATFTHSLCPDCLKKYFRNEDEP
ncbi:MAG: response regulator [Verrucomicrobiota bacterium]|jgi:DNA-binding NarL/FixJ family response regulator